MGNFEVDEKGIYKVIRTYSINCLSGECASEIREMIVSKDVLIEALCKWGLLKLAVDKQEVIE